MKLKPAIKSKSGQVKSVAVPGHHSDIGMKGKRGFLTTSGEFLNRGEAAKVAVKSGLVKKVGGKGLHSSDLEKGKK